MFRLVRLQLSSPDRSTSILRIVEFRYKYFNPKNYWSNLVSFGKELENIFKTLQLKYFENSSKKRKQEHVEVKQIPFWCSQAIIRDMNSLNFDHPYLLRCTMPCEMALILLEKQKQDMKPCALDKVSQSTICYFQLKWIKP